MACWKLCPLNEQGHSGMSLAQPACVGSARGNWSRSLAAGQAAQLCCRQNHTALGKPAQELMQEYMRCLITQQCFPTIHEYTYLQSFVTCRLLNSWVQTLIRHISYDLKPWKQILPSWKGALMSTCSELSRFLSFPSFHHQGDAEFGQKSSGRKAILGRCLWNF